MLFVINANLDAEAGGLPAKLFLPASRTICVVFDINCV